ncbi:MAG: cysteine synthase, partial [Pseudomonadota bacterium]|nr:cysteine synthase [Pseudomonadota bacterium]
MKVSVVAFEPAQSSFLTTGKAGANKVERVGIGFELPYLDRAVLSKIRTVDQEIGFAICRRLAKEEGI